MTESNKDLPNIIVILTDDQGYWALGCNGNREIRTPHLDRLAASGLAFDHYYCTSPVCSPARASLLTGKIPSQHGVHDWLRAGNSTSDHERDGQLTEFLKEHKGYTDYLAEAGYVCGISGKWHLGDSHHPQKSFSFWKVHARGGGPFYGAPMVAGETEVYEEPRYITDVFTDNALEFLDSTLSGSRPFCLSLNYTAPHSPWYRAQHPAEYFDPYYNDCPFESVPDEPPSPAISNLTDFFESAELRREKLSGYYASVSALDAGVGRIMDWLEQHGLREKTLVFFTSDNGMNMGHHGLCGKGNGSSPVNMYETSVRVPAIISLPGRIPSNRRLAALYSHYDFLPTLLDFVGIDAGPLDHLPGKSFAPVLRGAEEDHDTAICAFEEYGPVRMIRDTRFKLVRRYDGTGDELFDLQGDPDETRNLIDSAENQSTRQSLLQRMESWFDQYANPRLDGKTKPVTGRGQLDLAHLEQQGDIPFAQAWPSKWLADRKKFRSK